MILKIIELFKENKKPDDDLKSWLHRVVSGIDDSQIKTMDDLKKILTPLTLPPSKTEEPDFYTDYGSDSSYHTKTGKGECAA